MILVLGDKFNSESLVGHAIHQRIEFLAHYNTWLDEVMLGFQKTLPGNVTPGNDFPGYDVQLVFFRV